MKLRDYLKSLPSDALEDFGSRCGTSIGYLRKAVSVGTNFDAALCIKIERESGGAVTCEELRSDVDWAYLRDSGKREHA